MKANQIFTIFLIFAFLAPNFSYSSGTGSGASQRKMATAKDCPAGTEYRIKNKGVWGCYPSEKPKADSRCDQEFIDKFSAQQDCIRDGDGSACLYLASISSAAAGATGLGAFLGRSLKKLNPEKSFLERYKKTYEIMRQNQTQNRKIQSELETAKVKAAEKLYKELTGKDPKRNTSELEDKSYPGEANQKYINRLGDERSAYLKENFRKKEFPARWGFGDYEHSSVESQAVKDELLKQLQGPENERLRKIVQEHYRVGFNAELDLAQAFDRMTRDAVKAEFGDDKLKEYEKIRKPYSDKAEAARAKLDPTYEADMDRLSKQMDDTFEQRHLNDKYYDTQLEMQARRRLHQKTVSESMKAIESEFRGMLSKKYPQLVVVDALREKNRTLDYVDESIQAKTRPSEKEVARRARLESIKNSMFGGLGGAVAGVVAMEGVHVLAEKQIDLCSDDLKLTKAEVSVIRTHSMAPKLKGCSSIRLSDPKETLLATKEKFGFVPVGTCELALRESQAIAASMGTDNDLRASCSSIKGANFESGKAEDGSERFSCYGTGSDITYSFPVGSDGMANFSADSIKATFKNGDRAVPADVQAKEFATRMAVTKSREARLTVFTNAAFENSTSANGSRSNQTDYGSCYQKAVLNQAMKSIVDMVGACPATDGTSSGDGAASSAVEGVR